LPGGPATLLLGVMRDKEVDDMLRAVSASKALHTSHCIATEVPDTDRALPAGELAARWNAIAGGAAEAIADADLALERALDQAAAFAGPLVIAGSLYLVGHLRSQLVAGTISDTDA